LFFYFFIFLLYNSFLIHSAKAKADISSLHFKSCSFPTSKNKLKFIYNLPSHLIRIDAQAAQEDAIYVHSFQNAILPIMKAHEADCLRQSDPRCGSCGSPTIKTLQTPMSWLHIVEDPFVTVLVHGICNQGQCEIKMRQEIQDIMAEIQRQGHSQRPLQPKTSVEILRCKICGKSEDTKRCGRCRVVAYCGRSHQKADWTVHRKICIPKDP